MTIMCYKYINTIQSLHKGNLVVTMLLFKSGLYAFNGKGYRCWCNFESDACIYTHIHIDSYIHIYIYMWHWYWYKCCLNQDQQSFCSTYQSL